MKRRSTGHSGPKEHSRSVRTYPWRLLQSADCNSRHGYVRTERECSFGPLWPVERRFIQEPGDLAVRGDGHGAVAEIRSVGVCKEEGDRRSGIIRIGDSQTGVG